MAKTRRKARQLDDAPAPLPKFSVIQSPGFPVVGIGASAGGLAAFEAFFSAMPAEPDPGMAFVLVQHLAPDHKSILTELVKRYTRMQVFEATDGMVVQPNFAYIIPPNYDMAFLNGTLQLLQPSAPRGFRLPINFFFRSLAHDQRERAICIVLSGTGSDGTLGVRAVKGEGGMAMAQHPDSADYDGMPLSAIATGLVDYVLSPAEMPAQLMAYAGHAFGKVQHAVSTVAPKLEETLGKIFVLVRAQTGHDFSGYKQNTIARRIQRRMAVHHLEQPLDYVRYLQRTPGEVDSLYRDFLIGVTSFFREPEAFQALETVVLPQIFSGKPEGAAIRVWVPGCSTGEEAYSIAMQLHERREALQTNFQLQVFATDIDSHAIEVARLGIYPASISADLSAERLERHFVPEPDASYRVRKAIRDLLVFSEQNVTRDPPFSRLDLISCRNLLIYLGAALQKKLIPLFHYALGPNGFLSLGTSESIGEFSNLFAAVDRKSKLYQRVADTYGLQHPAMKTYQPPMPEEQAPPRQVVRMSREKHVPLRDRLERVLLDQYAPASAIVSRNGDIHYLHGRTGQYLEPAQGEASMNILKMAREGLRRELTMVLHAAANRMEGVRQPGVRVKTNGDYTSVDLEVRPMTAASVDSLEKGLFLVLFEESRAELRPADVEIADTPAPEGHESDTDARVAALQGELRRKEDYLQSTIEEMETSSEELRASHEEMQSVNEELQSANEELETSKEELQSVNEELATVNAELEQRVTDLSRANNDMNNLLAGTGIGTIFVDHQLRIQRFTPAVTQVLNVISTDTGRQLGHIVPNLFGYTSLVDDVKAVLDNLSPKEVEVQTRAGAWYLLRIRPYRTLENVIEGAVVMFFDITEMKRIREEQRLSEGRVKEMAASLPQLIWTFGADGGCDYVSPQWVNYTGIPQADQLGLGWLKQLHPEDLGRTISAWGQSLSTSKPFNMEYRIRGKDGVFRWFRSHVAPVCEGEAQAVRWFGANSDIDAERKASAALRDSEAKRHSLMESISHGVLFNGRDGRVVDANPTAERIVGLRLDQMLGKEYADLIPGAVESGGSGFPWETFPAAIARNTGRSVSGVVMGVPPRGKDGIAWLRVSASPVLDADQSPPYPVCLLLETFDRTPSPDQSQRQSASEPTTGNTS